MNRHTSQVTRDEGASAVEYGLIVFAIAAVITVVVVALGGYVSGTYRGACTSFESAGATSATGADCDS